MALIKCYECGKEISDKATSCPHCGAPIDKTTAKRTSFPQSEQTKRLNEKEQKRIANLTDEERKAEEENWVLRWELARRATEEREIENSKSKMNVQTKLPSKEIQNENYKIDTQSKPLANNMSITTGWVIGTLLILIGFIVIKDNEFFTGFFYIIGSLFLLPPIRNKVYQKTQIIIPPAYRIGIVMGALFFAMLASERAEASRAEEAKQKIVEEQAAKEIAQKEKELKEFKTNKEKIIHSVSDQIKNKSFKDALPICNMYMKFEDKDITPLCMTVKTEILKIEQKEQEERAKKEAAEAAKAKAREEAELKASMGPRAWKLHKKHPEWDIDDCRNVAKGKYWIGMTTEMMVASLGRPDSAKPSNYGNGRQWQYCYTDGWFQCLYDQNDDGIIDSYN